MYVCVCVCKSGVCVCVRVGGEALIFYFLKDLFVYEKHTQPCRAAFHQSLQPPLHCVHTHTHTHTQMNCVCVCWGGGGGGIRLKTYHGEKRKGTR